MTTLDQHLSAILTAEWNRGIRRAAAVTLKKVLDENPELQSEARARKADLEALDQRCLGQLEKRCSISAVHLRALRAALD